MRTLEADGVRPELVHAEHGKQIKGRKTDVANSLWLVLLYVRLNRRFWSESAMSIYFTQTASGDPSGGCEPGPTLDSSQSLIGKRAGKRLRRHSFLTQGRPQSLRLNLKNHI